MNGRSGPCFRASRPVQPLTGYVQLHVSAGLAAHESAHEDYDRERGMDAPVVVHPARVCPVFSVVGACAERVTTCLVVSICCHGYNLKGRLERAPRPASCRTFHPHCEAVALRVVATDDLKCL